MIHPVEVIKPYTMANPYDGWEVAGSFAEEDWEKAVDLANRLNGVMYLVPGMQPVDLLQFESQEGEPRKTTESYLTGGRVHWDHVLKQGRMAAREGRKRRGDIPDGCWARRAYDEGYDAVIEEGLP